MIVENFKESDALNLETVVLSSKNLCVVTKAPCFRYLFLQFRLSSL